MSKLPPSWSEVLLGDIASTASGIGFPKHYQGESNGDLGFYKVGDISKAVLEFKGQLSNPQHKVSFEVAKKLKGNPIPAGATVFAKIGEAIKLNRRAIVTSECLVDNNVMAVKAESDQLDQYLYLYLRTLDFTELSRATTVPSLRKGDIETLAVPLPPLNEQKRIADKLDAVLARVDACRDRLDRIPAILKRFRQSVLAAATSGELTVCWRELNGEYDWEASTLSACGTVSGGLTKNAKRQSLGLVKRYLRVANVYANRLELSDVAEIGLTAPEYIKTKLQSGDLLIVEGNGSLEQLGRVALWSGELDDCVHQNHLIRWRTAGPLPKFVLYWLLSPRGRTDLMDLASTTTGLHTLSISKVGAVPIQLPSIEEQAEIVRRVESLFAYADRLEARYNTARAQVEKLTPSLLAKAFRGELVPQDPSDEPASELLARIAAVKPSQSKGQSTRKRS